MALEDLINTANPGTDFADYGNETNYWKQAYSWEPKKKHQFIMEIDGIPAFLIKASAKPSIQNGEVPLDHINVKRYVKGKSEWQAISVTLYDPILPSATQAVMDWIRLHHESVTGRNGYSSMYKKNITLNQLSPLGEKIEQWDLIGAYIVDSNFGDLDWGDDGVMEIQMNLRYDYAIFQF